MFIVIFFYKPWILESNHPIHGVKTRQWVSDNADKIRLLVVEPECNISLCSEYEKESKFVHNPRDKTCLLIIYLLGLI